MFVEDFSLRTVEGNGAHQAADEADAWAEEALIPHAIWKEHDVRAYPIVAGRIRFEQKNYRLFTQFVGTGQIRSQFDATDS